MDLPIFVAVLIAILGALGGIAAIMKVQSDNSSSVAVGAKAVSEGAKTVLDMMNERLDDQEAHSEANTVRLDALEAYVVHFDEWADRLLDILDRAITMLPDALRSQFETEATSLKATRPKREQQRQITARRVASEKVALSEIAKNNK